MAELELGQTVELADGQIAVIRFIGQTLFAAGDWVGVELGDDTGKNDGSVQGERYFDCQLGRGMFVRPTKITVVEQPPPPPPKRNGVIKRAARPSSVVPAASKRLSSVPDPAAGRRMSINAASPSPANRRPSSMLRVGHPHGLIYCSY
jgi:dynactin 1